MNPEQVSLPIPRRLLDLTRLSTSGRGGAWGVTFMILLGPFSFYPTPLSPVLAVDANRVKTTCHQPLVFTFNNIRTNI